MSPVGLSLVDGRLAAALVQADELERTAASPAVRAVAERASLLLFRLRTGWNEMGLWAAAEADDASAETRFELWLAGRELGYRMRFIRRECLWAEKELGEADTAELAPLWVSLEMPAPVGPS